MTTLEYAEQIETNTEPPDLRPVLEECRAHILVGMTEGFNQGRAPDGTAWPARKDPRKTHPLLTLSGALKAAAGSPATGHVERFEADALEIGVEKVQQGGLPGAAVHQFGYAKRNIAARPYVGISEETATKCSATVARMLGTPK